MAISTNERTFENELEYNLIQNGSYASGNPADFDRTLAMDTKAVIAFVKRTQPREWDNIVKKHTVKAEEALLSRLNDELKNRGMLDVLRHGIKGVGINIDLCYFKPASAMNKTTVARYEQNELKVTRQVKYSLACENSIDTVIFLNGLPIITIELKNPLTGQTFQNAIYQYKNDRSPKDLLLSFKKRALVHFAVDSEQVYMATKLSGQDTQFLPFNKGNNKGAGNPANSRGHRTSYLWEEVLTKDSLMDILERFIHLEVKPDKETGKKKETLLFPRYHQLDVVRKLITDAKENGSGKNYLIQHSAGSGKSNSIAWLAHHLASLHDVNNTVIFNSIIVITDRRVLDDQLQKTIYQFEHTPGVVQKIDKNSSQLTEALKNNIKIIICTLQKFPFVDLRKAANTSGKRFAIIVDEAHSSQSGEASEKLKMALADIASKGEDAIEEKLHQYAVEEEKAESKASDIEDEIANEMASHGIQKNLSFFAFTATPKPKTLEMFGVKNSKGLPEAFHLYSMRQAIEEGFILDVLANYTTYETYFQIGKKIIDDPQYPVSKANKALGKFLSLHHHNLAQKTEIIVEHFRSVTRHRIGGRAKAMLVTGSRLHAVRYYFEFKKYISKKGYKDLGVLVAFSGTVKDGNVEYTEAGLNKFSETELPEKFDSGEYQVLLVAEKYQTGFDQPLLHTMYVDKKLSGVKAVQTLSRLNRMCKGKDGTFVLDFVNNKDDILKSFQPYYEKSGIDDVTDPNLVYDIKNVLDTFMVYNNTEIENFAKVFFKESKKQDNIDLGVLNAFIDPAVDRFNALTEEQEKSDFKSALQKFVRLYAFLTHIINLGDESLHKFNAYAKCLSRKLPKGGEKTPSLDNDVVLQYYRLQKVYEGKIDLVKEDGVLYGGQHGAGLPVEDDNETLSKIIAKLNEKLGTNFTEMDKVLEQFIQDMANNKDLVLRAKNPLDLFEIVYNNSIMDIVISRMSQNQEFCEKFLEDEEFRKDVNNVLLPMVHERLASM